ncbi:MAG TPA: hypothetical protein VK897_14395 [Anaerolineales bacterium]|nr:hypothetical protein [Anaerolineales bacterium]
MAEPALDTPVQEISGREVYVGPRPFERTEGNLFFGRNREISELLSLVLSTRVVLCYAPSGAGKTSLINAGLHPRLEQEGFEVLPSARVRGLSESVAQETIPNLYIFNALLSLAGEGGAPDERRDRSLAGFLAGRPPLMDEDDFPVPRVLIFDQFEELVTSYPEHWQQREGFFDQVREALEADPLLRVVFVMREDFLARIEPFLRQLKPFSQSHFRLDLLGSEGAHAAVTGPLRGTGRHFKPGAAEILIEELLKVRVETMQGAATEVVGEYVEPVQLQVVCRNLWTRLPPDVMEISPEHLEAYGDVDQALQHFYESCLAGAKASQNADERRLRQWFEQQLITPAGTRGIVFRDAYRTADLPNEVVDYLENQHLIRGEWRAGSRWYELTHDRFIEPIQRANERWRARRQARRNRLLVAGTGLLLLVLMAYAARISFQQQTVTQPPDVSTIVAATVVVRETAQGQVLVAAQEDLAVSKSRQLAAEALLALPNDPDLALLLAIGANRSSYTPEARRSLHKILSRQEIVDGTFLRELDPHILSPTLLGRWNTEGRWASSLGMSPDGRQILAGGENGMLALWDLMTDVPTARPLAGHATTIQAVAYSPSGAIMASAGQDGQILFWDPATGEKIGDPLLGHRGWVTCVAFSTDGRWLASGSDDGTLRIWDLSSEQPSQSARVVETGQHDVWNVAWSPDGTLLASAGTDATVRLWESGDFTEVLTLRGHRGVVRALAWGPDGRSLASGSYIEEGTKETGGEVFVWDTRSGEPIIRTPDDFVSVRTLAFDPRGNILAIGQYDGHIILWNTNSPQQGAQVLQGYQLKAHTSRVMSIVFTPDGRRMVSSGLERTIAVWDLTASTRTVAISPSGDLLAASQGTIISLWDLSSEAGAPLTTLSSHTEDILALEFTPDESTLVSAGQDDTILLWDSSTGQVVKLSGHQSDVRAFAISPDGTRLVSADQAGELRVWDIGTPKEPDLLSISTGMLGTNSAPVRMQFKENGNTLQLAVNDGDLALLDLPSDDMIVLPLPVAQRNPVLISAALSQNGEVVAYYTESGNPFLEEKSRAHGIVLSSSNSAFDPGVNPSDIDFVVVEATNWLQAYDGFENLLEPIQAVPIRGALHRFGVSRPWQEQADLFLSTVKDKGFHFYVLAIDYSLDGNLPVSPTDLQQWLKYVDERTEGKVLLQLPSAFSSLGPSVNWVKDWPLVIVGYPLDSDREGTPLMPQGVEEWRIWQYSEGQEMAAQYGAGEGDVLLAVYNGTALEMREWLALPDFSIFHWTLNKLAYPAQPVQVTGQNGIAFSPRGEYVAAAGGDTVFLLNAETGEEISSLSSGGRTTLSLSFTPDGNWLAIGTEEGTILVWDLDLLNEGLQVDSILTMACSRLTPNITDAQWQRYFGDLPRAEICPHLR